MFTQRSHGCFEAVLVGVLLFIVGSALSVSRAVTTNITSDGTLPVPTTVTQTGNVYDINGGTIRGHNQFHSFGQFSVGAGDIASFNGPIDIQNIISRVTGGNVSDIDGTIRSTIDGAALWLLNPAGIMFGQNAQLDVKGSFHASTADYLKLSDGGVFYADLGKASVLTSAPPSAFGFLTNNPAPIDVQAGNFDFNTFAFTPLQVPEGQTLSLVGGTLNLGAAEVRNEAGDVVEDAKPTFILAPGGRLNLVSVASAGEATFDGTGFNVDAFAQLGDINIKGGQIFGGGLMFPSYIDSKGVFIQGGQLVIHNALIWPGFFSLFGLGPLPDGGEVNVKVRGAVNITGTDVEPFLGNAPGIFTIAGALFEPPEFFPDAKVPDVTINAGSLTVANQASVQTARLGPGEPSNVAVNADTVTVENGGSISLLNFYEGPGGALTINAREVNLSGDGTPSPTGINGLAAQGLTHLCFGCDLPSGEPDFDPRLTLADSGSITVNATDRVNMSGDASIVTDSLAFGNGGDIIVNAKDMFLSGAGQEFTGSIQAQTLMGGRSGNITINATGQMQVSNGFSISASTSSNSDGGTVNVSAGQSITITGADSGIASTTAQATDQTLDTLFLSWLGVDYATLVDLTGSSNLFDVLAFLNEMGITNVTDLTPGNAGTIHVRTPLLTMNADTRIATSTAWDGNAGQVVGNFGSLLMRDGAAIQSQSGIEAFGQLFVGAGDAGLVSLSASDTIMVSGQSPMSGAGSTISTTTFGGGDGGDVSLNAANQIQINNGGSVTADSFGAGFTGDITMTADNSITLNNGTISTRAKTSDGGNIKLTAPNVIQLTNSEISTSVESGVGGGGNINLDPQFITVNHGQIVANAFGGPGGNISLTAADGIMVSPDSIISASSALSTQGTIEFNSPDTDVASGIAVLPSSFLDVSGLLRGGCDTAGGRANSLGVASRGTLPVHPDSYLPSFGLAGETQTASATGDIQVSHVGGGAGAIALASIGCIM